MERLNTPIAFLLINAEIGSESEVLRALKKIHSVDEAHLVWGVYDIVVKVKANTIDRLKEMIAQVRRMNNVQSTTTMMVAE